MRIIATPDAPKAIGPYSQAVSANGFVYTSGQVPLDPATGNLLDGPFEDQVHRALQNLGAVLREAGSGFDRVVKATVFLTDLSNFNTLNTVYAEYFGEHRPARTTVQVSALPRGASVEIDLVALA